MVAECRSVFDRARANQTQDRHLPVRSAQSLWGFRSTVSKDPRRRTIRLVLLRRAIQFALPRLFRGSENSPAIAFGFLRRSKLLEQLLMLTRWSRRFPRLLRHSDFPGI